MNDPGLFQPWFAGPSWDGWRVVLKAAFALPMTDAERQFFRSIADREPPTQRVREAWFVVGRRGGKDSIASLIAGYTAALFEPHHGRLRKGERALVSCLACDRDQAKIVLGYIAAYFAHIPPLRTMVTRETASGFELSNGVDIAIATNTYRNVRGRALLCAILDEAAFYRDETSSNPDEEVYRALKPGLATLPDSILIGISTPYRKSGLLYRKFRECYGRDDSDVLVVRAPSIALNPTLDPKIVDQALEEDPAAATAEWLAEFRDDIAGWASRELVEAAVDRGVVVRPPVHGISYRSFCDPSGGARDSFAMAIAHAEGRVAVLDHLTEIRAPLNPDVATAQIAETLRAYRCTSTVGDKYAAQWVVEAFRKRGIAYRHSEGDRSSIYLNVLPLLTSGRARLLDNKRLVHQLASLERHTTAIGKDRVDHAPGAHDDVANAAAGALALAMSHQPLLITPVVLERAKLRRWRPMSASPR
jgi:hypothetical protein